MTTRDIALKQRPEGGRLKIGTGGGGFRFMDAALLQEAGRLLESAPLEEASRMMTEAGNGWRQFAFYSLLKVVKF